MRASARAAEQKRAELQVGLEDAPASEAEGGDAVMVASLRDARVRSEFIHAYHAAVDEYRRPVKVRRPWRR